MVLLNIVATRINNNTETSKTFNLKEQGDHYPVHDIKELENLRTTIKLPVIDEESNVLKIIHFNWQEKNTNPSADTVTSAIANIHHVKTSTAQNELTLIEGEPSQIIKEIKGEKHLDTVEQQETNV